MSNTQKTPARQAWVAPRLVLLGKIADVAQQGKAFQGNGS